MKKPPKSVEEMVYTIKGLICPKVKRIQRRRTKGWFAPHLTMYVGRPSVWGNPFKVDDYTPDRDECIRAFRNKILDDQRQRPIWFFNFYIKPLLGMKHLSCWCKLDEPCHADVWVEIVNSVEVKAKRTAIRDLNKLKGKK